jgi:hypothetical protein
MRVLVYPIVVAASFSIVIACSSNETTNAADAATTCVLRDGACGTGCCAQSGTRYDEAKSCLGEKKVIGCTPKPATTGCGYLGVVGCAITPEGTWLTPDLAAGWTPPTACSDALKAKVSGAMECGAMDAGGD